MPTYDYRCEKCGNTFEVFQPITAPKLTTCPGCRGKLKRLMGSGAGIIFKGSGFYATDHRSKSYKEAEKKDKESAAPKTEPGTKGTAAPEKKAEAKS